MSQAVAALVAGDKSAFYRCGFVGVQDTLCDLIGRHYYKDCYIRGVLDFIFSQGQSTFQGCTIPTAGGVRELGYITAQGRVSMDDKSGFVFKWCNITGLSEAYPGPAVAAIRPCDILRELHGKYHHASRLGSLAVQRMGNNICRGQVERAGGGRQRKEGRVDEDAPCQVTAALHQLEVHQPRQADNWIQAQPS